MRASKQPGTSKQASKHLWWGQEDGQEEKAAKITAQPKRRQSHGVGFHKLALFSGTTGPLRRGKEKSTRACNVHTWPSKQVSRGRKERGPCHKMPRSFTVKSTTSRRWRRREKTEEEKYNRGGLSQGRVKTKVHSGYMAVGSSSPQQRS